jgi:glutathione peroxidase
MRYLFVFLSILLISLSVSAGDNFHSFKVKDIDGKDFDLASLKGKLVMVVNVASKCGLTPQYKDLQKLHEKYSDKGLVILGFPANNFGKQEPGTNFEIKTFCTSKYNVTFQMMAKVDVREEKAALYKYLTGHTKFGGEIKWNFEKFLIGPDGEVLSRFTPKTKPKSKEVISAIETSLKKMK